MSTMSLALEKVVDSFFFLKPMFDLNPVDQNLQSNMTFSYSHIFGFEKLFESKEFVDGLGKWMNKNWTMSINISIIYVVFIFLIKFYMKNKTRYELRFPLIIWNIVLASFSILGTIRTWPEFFYSITQKGIVYSVCDSSYAYGVTGFWAFMFIMSKLPELIDTIFIVFRKQELIFLHWYHHATVLIYCWYSYSDFTASGRWFMTMNYFVHSIMYSYYACKALRIRVPLFVSKLITTSQLVQMIFGCYVNWVAYHTKKSSPNSECNISNDNIFYSFLMYLSYFALFFHFFFNAYILKRKNMAKQNGKVLVEDKKNVNGKKYN
uniref:Elongation of very long chain fatty acids protein n=1 Tax=Brachionus koreanus TaxID=1199090 RepID=A0A291LM86_9BILA|nr:elongase 4 [Brachionus koreanus]QBO55908.1 elongation of very long chain fatty acid 3/6a [Brachionus koreanus]